MPPHFYQWHPIFVHFTIALLAASVAFYAIAWLLTSSPWKPRLVVAAELNLWAGIALTALTVALGWIAFDTVPHDDSSHELMARHRNFALATSAVFAALAAFSPWHRRHARYPSPWFVAGLLLGLAGLGATGLLGGQLVYEHGLAVERPPGEASGAESKRAPRVPEPESAPHHHHAHQ